ncbi:hypothetical protein MMC11_000758 [Xylographa trunciseda]|nr:hypothetical protein [Xylographa trunciseda]
MLKLLAFPAATECILDTDRIPAWEINGHLEQISKQCDTLDGRKILLVHYAGHTSTDSNGELLFLPTLGAEKPALYMRTLYSLCEDHLGFELMDVVMILDSCYSGTAIRGIPTSDRSVEIIASVGTDGTDQTALGNTSYAARTQNTTFTSRLVDQVALRVGRGILAINFAEIIGGLRRTSQSDRTPQYSLQRGKVGIRIALPSLPPHARATKMRPSSSSDSIGATSVMSIPDVRAIFKVHLSSPEAASGEVQKIVEWIHQLNPAIGLEISGLYSTRSTCLILEAPWHIWALLQNSTNLDLVCETFEKNQLPDALAKINRNQLDKRQENLPPRMQEPLPLAERKG